MLIVDASVWIDSFYRAETPQARHLWHSIGRDEIGLTTLTLCEVLQGIRGDARFRGIREDLKAFPVFEACSAEVAVEAAQYYRKLQAQGITVRRTIDCIIATFCVLHGYHLLHDDRDFDPFEKHFGLKVMHPHRSRGRSSFLAGK